MNAERFAAVIAAVEKQPEELWDMSQWVKCPVPGGKHCGTAACAIGSFCLQNPDAELRLFAGAPELLGADLYGFEAVAAFLEISDRDSEILFDPYEYDEANIDEHGSVAKAVVLDRLREFYAEHGGE